ncbi:dimethyladenosine transferase 1, mitochondrial-like [Tetranychus urticae]|uniref:rRNA adenine N(6)-methyltransferase n=1 Tax=Tetranychus urticae TaxID=32264 RepID=T1K198_TETUR|nr:dimethyladenosine transferase 1, mitochondrial-like [Tetranychus urticae]
MRGLTSKISQEAGKSLAISQGIPGEITQYVPQRLPPMPSFRDLLAIYGIRGRKQLSQNFIMRPATIRRIVKYSCIKPGETVVEVGPGPGNITREILSRGPRELFVIEKDRRFLPMLEMLADAAYPGQMKIMLGDIRDIKMDSFFHPDLKRDWLDKLAPIHIFSNLPFNIASVLLIQWMHQLHTRTGAFAYGRVPMSLTFQYEVAQRLSADIFQYGRSRVSVMTQLWCNVHRKCLIPGNQFFPKPQVDVGLVRLIPRRVPLVPTEIPFKVIDRFVKHLFHLRRKILRRSLHCLFHPKEKHLVDKICIEAGVSVEDLPIMLSNEEIARMIQVYWGIVKESPELLDYDHTTRKKEPKILRDMFSEKGFRVNKRKPIKVDDRNLNE